MKDHIREAITNIIYKAPYSSNPSPEEIEILNSFPAEDAIEILQTIFKQDTNRTIKSKTFGGILGLHKFDHVQFLLDSFKGVSIDWQIAYVRALSQFQDPRAVQMLSHILLEAKNPDLRYTAAESLAEIGDTSAISALEHAQQHDKGKDYEGFPIADVAAEALKRIREKVSRRSNQ